MRIPSFALLAALLLPLPALADTVTYTYTGNDFNDFSTVGGSQAYTSSDFVSGEFTLSAPLADSLTTLTAISPISFSFSDGINTITNLSTPVNPQLFEVTTNASGSIQSWMIELSTPNVDGEGTNDILTSDDFGDTDQGVNDFILSSDDGSLGLVIGSPGTWTSSTAATPEPSSLILLVTGVAGAYGLARRRLQQA